MGIYAHCPVKREVGGTALHNTPDSHLQPPTSPLSPLTRDFIPSRLWTVCSAQVPPPLSDWLTGGAQGGGQVSLSTNYWVLSTDSLETKKGN